MRTGKPLRGITACFSMTSCLALMACSGAALAQGVPQSSDALSEGGINDIIVTARKRDETSLSAPVTIAALGASELQRRNIVDLESIARTVPQLIIGNAVGNVQGGAAISLRGISAGDSNPLGDQAIAFNIDGVQIARSSPKRMGEFDMAQVEILKGPQALYFGKNSPGGVVVLHSADPTSSFKAGANIGYEFNAKQVRGEAFVSGPVTESLGVRLAAYGSKMQGWVDNVTPDSPGFGATHKHAPGDKEFGGRLTVKLDTSERFDARLKLAFNRFENQGSASNAQRVNCPFGAPQRGFGTNDDCVANDTVVRSDFGTAFAALDPTFGNGVPYLKLRQYLGSLEMNYHPAESLTLTSQTGYYKFRNQYADDFNTNSADTPAARATVLVSTGIFDLREVSQEVRLASDFNGPLNFTIGGYYQDSHIRYATTLARNALAPTTAGLGTPAVSDQGGKAYSLFAQTSYKPIETLELSAGARYSHEKKTFRPTVLATGAPLDPTLPGGTVVPEDSWHDVSPEFVATWRPTNRFTAFVAYKEGFLSGGFNGGSGGLTGDRSYDQQVVKGFEGGIKGLFLDGALRANAALYSYKITGQQVTAVINIVSVLTNAASSKSEGAEFDLSLKVPSTDLTVRSGLSYNRANYSSYRNAPCYAGQTPAMGCTIVGTPVQNLSGQQLVRAPKWGGNVGAFYDLDIGNGNSVVTSLDGNYTSSYFTEGTNNPNSRQSGYWLLDGSISYKAEAGYELSLIGRNLTNKYYYQRATDSPFTGSGTGTAAGVLADTTAFVSRGREVMVRLSYRL